MSEPLPKSVAGFIDELATSEKTLMLLNRTEPEPLVNLLRRGLDDQPVTIAERQIPEGTQNMVCLIDGGEVVALTPLARLEEAYLLVNADRYRTGTQQIERESFPDVLTGLNEVEFTVRGYPTSAKEKLTLILISRFIEFQALSHGRGTLRTTFQYLSRLDDELGTRTVYEWLADSNVDTHVYGVNDAPEMVSEIGITAHSGTRQEYRRSWVVVFTPPQDETTDEHAALVAVETGPNLWRGMWTYDPAHVSRVNEYLTRFF
jgi:hypothetical protein